MTKRKKPTRRPRPVDASIGLRVAARREELGWTQEMVAGLVGAEVIRISRIENGKVHLLADELRRLSSVLAVPAHVLLGGGADSSTGMV